MFYDLYENRTHNFFTFNYTHNSYIKLLLTIRGDITGDRTADMLDISIVIDAFMTFPGTPLWNPLADLTKDNSVDMSDISIIVENFLKTWSL